MTPGAGAGLVIGTAAPEEADAVVGLWHEAGLTRPWNDPHADLARALASPTSTVLVARETAGDGVRRVPGVVGSVMAGDDGHRGWLYYLATAERARGRGVARALVGAAEEWLAGLGAPKVQLMVRAGNPAESLYPHLGYEIQEVVVWGRRLDPAGRITTTDAG